MRIPMLSALITAAILGMVIVAPREVALSAQGAPGGAAPALTVQPLTAPAGADAEAPNLSVTGDRVILSWIEKHEDHVMVKFAERTASGWSDVRTVVSGSEVMANAADVPVV